MTSPDADAPALVMQALDLLAHELRNATSTLWSGTGLMVDAEPGEVMEIASDVRPAAELALLLVDLVVEAARSTRGERPLDHVDVRTLFDRASARAGRGGVSLELRGDVGGEPRYAAPGTAERLLCAAALATGHRSVGVTGGGDELVFTPDEGAELVHPRVCEAANLLATALAGGAGAWYRCEDQPCRVLLGFAPVSAE